MVAASSASRTKSVKRVKKGTETTKSHRFEPFSQRVAKLKIDPIHRVRQPDFGEEDDETSSYFRSAFEHWAELNLSENFVQFSRRVNPLCESLAQILYYEDKIMGLLVEFIEKRDQLSMEPLLSLLAQFARDLGVRFEKHFATAVSLVASVAATHPQVEVVEWSFTCLAWIFKFLSRLLVPDLRQLLGIMTPYLGKERQKPFVARFAAESMSFLIRKAGLLYYKNNTPLTRAVSFLLHDLRQAEAESKNVEIYKEGLMTMFSDAIKGVKGGIHSNGTDILGCFLDNLDTDDDVESSLGLQVASGILINLIHCTTVDTFEPILDTVISYIESNCQGAGKNHANSCCRLIFLCVSARKGSRVKNWKPVLQALLLLLQSVSAAPGAYTEAVPQLLTAVAYTLQLAPMDEMLPFMRSIMETVTSDQLSNHFLSFCATFSEWGAERFHSVVLPYFQKFVNVSWQEYEYELCLALLRLSQTGCITSEVSKPGYIICPVTWKDRIKDMLSNNKPSVADVTLLNAYSQLPRAMSLSTEPSLLSDMSLIFHDQLARILKSNDLELSPETKFFIGQGFKSYVELATLQGGVDTGLWDRISVVAAKYSRLDVFLEATLAYVSACSERLDLQKPSLEELADVLITNLAGPSHQLRLLSLKILRVIVDASGDDSSLISVAIEIEESPLTLQSARYLAMQVRKLAISYPQVVSRRWMPRLIPNFCFGLFSKKMAPLWDDSAAALKSVSEQPEGEIIVSDLAIQWLQEKGSLLSAGDSDGDDNMDTYVTGDFQCYNAARAESLCAKNFEDSEQPASALMQDFEKIHSFSEVIPASPQTHALRVLNAIPNIAEKRSRQVVPLFLSWALHDDEDAPSGAAEKSAESGPSFTWGFHDRLAFLGLLGQFVNPKVLFKAPEVHDALLGLLCHGNSEIQKLALKALFTWKSSSISPYRENLLNILDESRFKDELSVFVQAGGEDSLIDEGHRGELIPVLLRLLYGRMISKAGASATQAGQSGRRKAILRTLAQLPDREFEFFMRISFGPLGDVHLVQNGEIDKYAFSRELASPKKQAGLLKTIETVFEALQSRVAPYASQSMDVVLYCLVLACRELGKEQTADAVESQEGRLLAVLRNIRHLCIRCLDLIFSISPDRDWAPYVRVIFDEVITPRLENFATETAQGVSGLLKLFHVWASSPRSSFYLAQYNNTLLDKIVDCLGVESARDEVKIFVMDDILTPLIELATGRELEEKEKMSDFAAGEIQSAVLVPYIEHTLSHLGALLKRGPSRPVLNSGVQTLSLLAPCVESSGETSRLISITTYLLRQPPDRVSPKTKSGLLRSLEHFLPLYDPQEDINLSREVFEAISSMFDYFKDDTNREVLSRVFTAFSKRDSELTEVANLCEDLNSVSRKKLEVDYERRLQGFRKINECLWNTFNARQWRPLLYNMLYHVKDEEELAIRSSSSFGLKRFIERAAAESDNVDEFELLVKDVLIPALQNGVRQKSELIRSEFVSALGYFVKLNPNRPAVQDMHVLLVGDDEEASFFNNILHIQQHRRLRALRRLASEAGKGNLQASNISTVFIPLNEHFVFDEEADEGAHNLIAEAVATIGVLAESLDWSQFRAIFRRYRGYMHSKSDMEKNILRLLGRMSDALTTAMSQKGISQEATGGETDGVESTTSSKCTLAQSLPSATKVATELTTNFIPFLTDFIHHKDEAQMSLRLPAAVTTIKLLKLLPEADMATRLPPVLLDVCSTLKSKAQDSRDTARKTINEIALLLGPIYFAYILKELKSTLTKGYQRHVLSFTVHSMLVVTTDEFKQGDLDYCLGDLSGVVMDDIFGTVGQEKDAEEYVSKMKEVKSSKSYDSMELLAKNASVQNLARMIRPLQSLLRERLNSNIVRKVDELLRRIGVGLLRNPGAESRDLLVFCYEVIKESYREPVHSEKQREVSVAEERFLVKFRKRDEKRGSTSSYTYKLTRFALDVLRSVLNKFDTLLTPANLAGFIPVIGDALVQAHEEVKVSALRLLSTMIKLPLADLDNNSHVYLTEAVKVIKEAPSTNTEAAQASLKLIAAMLRERKSTNLRDGHLAYLLQRLTADIEEPDRQGVTFNFIRAVMSRKFVVPEMYELVDHIATMMVTNQTRSARDLARGVYIHFLVEFPQAKSRWTKQLSFLAKNLEYKHPEGRQSVMEAINLLLSKTGHELAQDIVGTFFLPVVIVMANDDTPECREMAGVLLGQFYTRADREQMKTILTPLRSWLEQTDNMLLSSAGLQAMRIYFEAEETEKEKEARFITEILPSVMQPVLEDDDSENWQTLYFALQLFAKLSKAVPSIALSKQCTTIWAAIRECLFYPHAWVKTCAANLVGTWLADLAKSNAENSYSALPLAGATGLMLEKDAMIHLIRASLRCLRTPAVSEELAMQSVRNIIFLARCCAQNGLVLSKSGGKEAESDASDSDDDADEEEKAKGEQPVLHYIFVQVSSILRREIISTRQECLIPKTVSIGLLAALCRHLDSDQIRQSLSVILVPLQHMTDSSIPAPRSSDEGFRNSYKALVSNCHEVLDLIQKKLGTTEYVNQMSHVQELIKERREGRRVKRRIEAVTEPERYEREKKRRNDRKRDKRKEKGMEHRARRRGW
ncbi:putative HEAT repeat protein (DRIM) [Aspergillus tanneri]|uniref:U3 snoRNP protein n=1 Tax=Aspergillus tanneri TaxID=1220188 RepID=A0A5M9MBY6_9EURO|nr:U3 snoRNP protein [Aspergillus tanneri]KAA8644391.1 U3 snoRNP protein [Aspergillus tanneri]